VVVSIPVMGRYNEAWPLNCPKSDKIVRLLEMLEHDSHHRDPLDGVTRPIRRTNCEARPAGNDRVLLHRISHPFSKTPQIRASLLRPILPGNGQVVCLIFRKIDRFHR